MSYSVELDYQRLQGCSLSRRFPWVVRDEAGETVQYAQTEEGAKLWIARQNGKTVEVE